MRKNLGVCLFGSILLLVFSAHLDAQTPDQKPPEAKAAEAKPAAEAPAPKEESSTTDHTIRIGNQTINYKATAGTILLKNDKDEPTALIYSTSYVKSDVKDPSQRPISFIYNGGPGSSSIWLHMGAFGPRRAVTVNADFTPPPPYQMADNMQTLLDKTDMVFIDPVGTGFSHAVGKAANKDFYGIDQDVKSLAQFVNIYVTRNDRWNSPKFLIGESYGTFRSAALGNYLQSHDSMQLNGIVLISSVLDFSTLSFDPEDDRPYIGYLPSYAAIAWYHKMLKDPPADLTAFLDEVRHFAVTEYDQALLKGDRLTAGEKADMAKKLSRYTGLSEDYLIKADLRVNEPQFAAELQRNRGLNTGRIDARFSGPSLDLLSEYAFNDPQGPAIGGAYVALWNAYVRDDLKFVQTGEDKTYHVFADGTQDWDFKHAGPGVGFPSSPNVGPDLATALQTNPHLQVEVENGYFDLATPFFATEFTMDHLGLPESLKKNITLKYYTAGHMMYLHDDDRVKLHESVAAFIDRTAK